MKLVVGLVAISIIILKLASWKNPEMPKKPALNIHEAIYNDGKFCTIENQFFKINYVKNSSSSSINPGFPSIHITVKEKCDGWLHLVYIDSTSSKKVVTFVDTTAEIYPMYTMQDDFYDAPYWKFTLISRPLNYWKGHAYPVVVNVANKVIYFNKGIEWGFMLQIFKTEPKSIIPRVLNDIEIRKDLEWLESSHAFSSGLYKDYKIIKRDKTCVH